MSETALVAEALYRVVHCRKGTFTMWVTEHDDEWAHGRIVDGVANAKSASAKRYSGEDVTVRKSFCEFTRLDGPEGGRA